MSSALVLRDERRDLLPSQETWQTMLSMAQEFVKSGLLPDTIKTAAAAVVVMQKGRELDIPPMAAFAGISIIKGKPTCGAELMLALIKRDHGSAAIRVAETTDQSCTVEYRLPGWDGVQRYSFTIEQARQARLGGDNWQKYPAAMLRARCISAVARMAFPESIGGMHTPEELGASVEVLNGDEVVLSQPRAQVREIHPAPETEDDPLAPQPGDVRILTPEADDPRERAMRKLHAVAKEHGWDHDDLHNLAYTEIGAESMQELGQDDIYYLLDIFADTDAQALMDKRQSMRTARNVVEIIDNHTGEVTTAPAPKPQQPVLDSSLLDLKNAIDGAGSDADLLRIGADMSASKINDREIWERFRAKRAAFAAVAR